MATEKLERLVEDLKNLSDDLSKETSAPIPSARAKKVRESITLAYDKLRKVVEDLDPIKRPEVVFDPANPNVVGRIVAITMIAQSRKPLGSVERFYGSGVYAIYYSGDFPGYSDISGKEHPIYVGKADPMDGASKTAVDQGDRLSNRINEHRKNIIRASSTLRIEDFEYRALVVQTGWQDSAEGYLIQLFRPIWNSEVGICFGFGKHGDDPKTRSNLRSPWDTLHPGREWAHRDPDMKDSKSKSEIIGEIKEHLSQNPPFKSIDIILQKFLKEIRTVH